jgi:hypothetical protein
LGKFKIRQIRCSQDRSGAQAKIEPALEQVNAFLGVDLRTHAASVTPARFDRVEEAPR